MQYHATLYRTYWKLHVIIGYVRLTLRFHNVAVPSVVTHDT